MNAHTSCRVVREQWIRAKYERREFLQETDVSHRPYETGERQGGEEGRELLLPMAVENRVW